VLPCWIHSHNWIWTRIRLGRWIEVPRVLAGAFVALRHGPRCRLVVRFRRPLEEI
jgi:hypothetical protein